jgi:uncharacterized protein
MYNLGLLYETGLGVAEYYGKARDWYQKAAEAGNSTAMYKLARLYLKGPGVAHDDGKAREWLQKAADAGNPWAKQALDDLLGNGR